MLRLFIGSPNLRVKFADFRIAQYSASVSRVTEKMSGPSGSQDHMFEMFKEWYKTQGTTTAEANKQPNLPDPEGTPSGNPCCGNPCCGHFPLSYTHVDIVEDSDLSSSPESTHHDAPIKETVNDDGKLIHCFLAL